MHSAGTKLDDDGSALTLWYDYDRYHDDQFVGIFRSGLRFLGVRAYRHRAEALCTSWHVEGAYDSLIEIEGLERVAELHALSMARKMDDWKMHHYMIYLDSSGCYEETVQ